LSFASGACETVRGRRARPRLQTLAGAGGQSPSLVRVVCACLRHVDRESQGAQAEQSGGPKNCASAWGADLSLIFALCSPSSSVPIHRHFSISGCVSSLSVPLLAQLINFEDSQVFGIDLSENNVTVLNFLQLFSEIQQLNLLHNNIGMSRFAASSSLATHPRFLASLFALLLIASFFVVGPQVSCASCRARWYVSICRTMRSSR
jgi:hypothetical protein